MADENIVRLKINGDVFELDMTDLTLDEVGTIEDLTGKSADAIDWSSARGIQGMVWIMMHRRDPRFTLEDVGRIKFSSIGEPEEERPTEPGAKPRGKSGAVKRSPA